MNTYFPIATYLNAWKNIFSDSFDQHVGPGCMIAGAATLMGVLRDRNQAAGLFCAATALYPITRHQIKRLMQVDFHETLFGVAILVIEIFRKQFPHLGFLTLPMTLALAYSVIMKGVDLRTALEGQKQTISAAQGTNGQLNEYTKSLETKVKELENEIENLEKRLKENHSLDLTASELQTDNVQTTNAVVSQLRELLPVLGKITDPNQQVENGSNVELANLLKTLIGMVSGMQKNTPTQSQEETSESIEEEQQIQAQIKLLIEVQKQQLIENKA